MPSFVPSGLSLQRRLIGLVKAKQQDRSFFAGTPATMKYKIILCLEYHVLCSASKTQIKQTKSLKF